MQHFRAGAEGHQHVRGFHTARRARDQLLLVDMELVRIGALEGVDRLLFVAHDEQRARVLGLFTAHAGEEFLCQGMDERPLVGAGILGLIEQDMADPAIELVEHPGGLARQGEQGIGRGDEIVEIQGPARTLGCVIGGKDRPGEGDQRQRALNRPGRAPGCVHRAQAGDFPPFGHSDGEKVFQVWRHRLGEGIGFAVTARTGLPDALHQLPPPGGVFAFEQGDQPVRQGDVGFRGPGPQALDRGAVFRDRQIGQHGFFQERLSRDVRRLQLRAQLLGGLFRLKPKLLARPAHQPERGAETKAAPLSGQRIDHLRAGIIELQHASTHCLLPHALGIALLDLAKPRRDARLQREPPQKPRTKRVDRLDAQPAGGLQRLGKEGTRLGQLLRRIAFRRPALQGGELGQQLSVIHHRPGAELAEQPGDHLIGGGTRIGDAENGIRRGILQQEARDPVDQHLGLAGARIGRHPGRMGRVRCGRLRPAGVLIGRAVGREDGLSHR